MLRSPWSCLRAVDRPSTSKPPLRAVSPLGWSLSFSFLSVIHFHLRSARVSFASRPRLALTTRLTSASSDTAMSSVEDKNYIFLPGWTLNIVMTPCWTVASSILRNPLHIWRWKMAFIAMRHMSFPDGKILTRSQGQLHDGESVEHAVYKIPKKGFNQWSLKKITSNDISNKKLTWCKLIPVTNNRPRVHITAQFLSENRKSEIWYLSFTDAFRNKVFATLP